MLLYTLCTIIAIIWLSYRLYRFLSIPILTILSNLNINTPPAIKASIDKISTDSITVHWENEPVIKSANHISHFLLYVNSIQLATFPNDPASLYTCCLIKGLHPQQQYQLDFVTINNVGFINKLHSIYCMTKSTNAEKNDKIDDSLESSLSNELNFELDENNDNVTNTKSRRWRRNTVSSVHNVQSTDLNTDYLSTSTIPSYTNLTKLQDLDSYSIDDLKKILICAQEDLHDVLAQEAATIQDFDDTKLNLELELENLKTQRSHEIDFKKSLKSNIKSLENAKLLSDLKIEKDNQKIETVKSKIDKMNQDIENWSEMETTTLNNTQLNLKYERLTSENENELNSLTEKIKILQQGIVTKEDENKKLNTLKKTSSSTNLMEYNDIQQQAQQQQQQQINHESQNIAAILKKINDCTSDRTGLLNNNGEFYLSKLNENSPIVRLIKDQIRIDQDFEQKWRSRKVKLIKRIKFLENKFNDISFNNRQLKTGLYAQPYQQAGDSSNEIVPIASTSSYNSSSLNANINSDSQTMFSNDNNTRGNNPLLSAFNTTVPMENVQQEAMMAEQTISPQLSQSPFVSYTQIAPSTSMNTADSINGMAVFPRGVPTTATSATVANPTFPWGPADEQQQQQQQQHSSRNQNDAVMGKNEIDNVFDYGNANHLITGLENMIYDETEYSDNISNYSKAYTTDQLDNYWVTQKDFSNGSIVPQRSLTNTGNNSNNNIFRTDFSPTNPTIPSFSNDLMHPVSSSPLLGHESGVMGHTPTPSVSLMQPQSLLAATLNDSSNLSPFHDNNLSMSQNESFFRNTMNNNTNGMNTLLSPRVALSPNNSNTFMAVDNAPNTRTMGYNLQQNISSQKDTIPNTRSNTNNTLHLNNDNDNVVQNPVDSTNGNGQGIFHSPSFNFIWNSTMSPSKSSHKKSPSNVETALLLSSPSKGDPLSKDDVSELPTPKSSDRKNSHKRNKSSGSISSWSNRLSLKSRSANPSISSTVIEDINSSEDDNNPEKLPEDATPTSNGGGKRMSRLLSRSGMNNLFKLQNHDTQPTS